MFDPSNPQQRERLLVIVAATVLCAIVVVVLPMQFTETTNLKHEREKLRKNVEELELLAQNKDEIQNRLSTLAAQALAFSGNEAPSAYNVWLMNLVNDAGLQYTGSGAPNRSGTVRAGTAGNVYAKWTFTVNNAEGRLDQIADFFRRFHRADYLHLIKSFSFRPNATRPGIFIVSFTVEALALPGTRFVNVPEVAEMTDEDEEMLATIRNRAILSQYTPPRTPQQTPPRPPFFNAPYCFVIGITESDGKPRCWIDIRTTGRSYCLFEEESFLLDNIRCTVKKIEVLAQRIQVAAEGEVYAVSLGNTFDKAADENCYYVTLVDADGNPWTEESTGNPMCEIEYDPVRVTDGEKYTLKFAEEETFPMKYVTGTIKKIDSAANQVQIEAAGVLYTLKNGGAFSEFADE